MNNYYVYTHTKIGEDIPFYIGKGYNRRAYSKGGRSTYWHNVAKNGYNVDFEFENLDEDTALQMEKDLIKMWGRRDIGTGCLVNLTDGGEGISGYIMSDEQKKSMSVIQKGNKHFLGHTHTEESRKKMSDKIKEKMTIEIRKKLSDVSRGKKRTDETKKRQSIAALNRSSKSLENIAKSLRKYQYTITSPTGEVFITSDLSSFCKLYNLCAMEIRAVARGARPHHKKYTVTRTPL
jgi:hypothetical protein